MSTATQQLQTYPDVKPRRLSLKRVLVRDPATAFAWAYLVLVVLVALAAPWIAPSSPTAQDLTRFVEGPSAQHWLGTDDLGRDVLSRLIYGTRVSLQASIIAVVFGLVLGLPIGLVAGVGGRVVDEALMRFVDALQAFPSLVLAIGITAMLGPGLGNAMVAIGITFLPVFARLMRAQTLSVKEHLFVEAARSFGSSPLEIVLRHIVPNAIQPIVVQVALLLSVALLAESALSFLGMGVQPPEPSWGQMLASAYRHMQRGPLQMLVPGLAITLSAFAFNTLAEVLRQALDPRNAFTRA